MKASARWITVAAAVFAIAVALRTSPAAQGSGSGPGAPLRGLTAREFSEFRLGLDDFLEVETAEDGLGPAYNATSCAVCHNAPAIGGGSSMLETRAMYREENGQISALAEDGETLMHMFSTPTHGCQPIMPANVAIVARRAPIPVFGAGLVEAIPDATLVAMADPDDRNRDGISGRAPVIRDVATGQSRVGRFGWKSQHATLLAFSADAYRNEMGITNDLFPRELAVGVSAAAMAKCDPRPDPEDVRDRLTQRRGIDNFETFMKFLAPVERAPATADSQSGGQVFVALGCASCHVPELMTGPSANPLFDRKPVALFSDLLLHDIGTGDGIPQGAALPSEIRTPALWGLRVRRPLMHDGRAATLDDAILSHGGEALASRNGFAQLPEPMKRLLRAFLDSL
jgi:CxxC motif-containing protein (DUF1111 family)